MKKIAVILISMVILMTAQTPIISYADDAEHLPATETAATQLNAYEVNLVVNQTFDLIQTGDIGGYFYSENEQIAGVDSHGVITARAEGTTNVCYTASNGEVKKCTVNVKVTDLPLTLSKSKVKLIYDKKLKTGTEYRIKYDNSCGDFYGVTYVSKNEKIAVVDGNGNVVPKGTGTTEIEVSADGKSAACTVQITSTANTKLSLNETANRYAIKQDSCKRYVYGTSVQGRELEAYIIKGKKSKSNKILFIDFACHGFEDSYSRDGKVLVNIGNEMVKYYSLNPGKLKGYTLVVVPCVNPDGTIAGKNNMRACRSAFGRCTAKHVDMNRDFTKFRAKESKALKKLFSKYNPDVYLNFHGWLNTSIGTPWLARLSSKKLSLGRVQAGSYGNGYIISYVRRTYNASVCLVEYKSPKSAKKSINKTKNFINTIAKK